MKRITVIIVFILCTITLWSQNTNYPKLGIGFQAGLSSSKQNWEKGYPVGNSPANLLRLDFHVYRISVFFGKIGNGFLSSLDDHNFLPKGQNQEEIEGKVYDNTGIRKVGTWGNTYSGKEGEIFFMDIKQSPSMPQLGIGYTFILKADDVSAHQLTVYIGKTAYETETYKYQYKEVYDQVGVFDNYWVRSGRESISTTQMKNSFIMGGQYRFSIAKIFYMSLNLERERQDYFNRNTLTIGMGLHLDMLDNSL